METKLLPCPFCGGEASLTEGFYSDDSRGDRPWIVSCKSCFALVRQFPDWENWNPYCDANVDECEAEMLRVVIETWNTRAERTCKPSEPQKCLSGTDCPAWKCSECDELFELGANYCSNCGARVVG